VKLNFKLLITVVDIHSLLVWLCLNYFHLPHGCLQLFSHLTILLPELRSLISQMSHIRDRLVEVSLSFGLVADSLVPLYYSPAQLVNQICNLIDSVSELFITASGSKPSLQ